MANWNNNKCGNCGFTLPAENPISAVLPIITCAKCGKQTCPKCNPTPSHICLKCGFESLRVPPPRPQ